MLKRLEKIAKRNGLGIHKTLGTTLLVCKEHIVWSAFQNALFKGTLQEVEAYLSSIDNKATL